MTVRTTIATGLALGCINAFPAFAHAADQRVCLEAAERSGAVAAHEAMPLGEAIKKLRNHGHKADVVRARLCRRNGHLDYVLTMLTRSGKVISIEINATSGDLVTDR